MKSDARNAAGKKPATAPSGQTAPKTYSSGTIDASKRKQRMAPELHRSAAEGRTQAVREAIMSDPNAVRQKDKQGFTALHHAAVGGHPETIQALLDGGAKHDRRGSRGETALYLAASKGHAEAVRTLLAAGADPETPNSSKSTPLHKAAMIGNVETVKVLLEGGADAEAKDRSGRTAMDLAERYKAGEYTRVMSELRKAGK